MSKKLENALYVRSANHFKHSLDLQRKKGEYYAKQHSLHLSIIEDPHLSSRTSLKERPSLRWLTDLIEVVLIKNVIVDSRNRISRDFVGLSHFLSLLEQHNANLIVLDGGELYGKK